MTTLCQVQLHITYPVKKSMDNQQSCSSLRPKLLLRTFKKSFIKWCSHKKLDFLQVGTKRETVEGDEEVTTRTRSLHVMKNEYLDDVAYKINNYLPSYQNFIKKLKEEGHTIIGYMRKPPGKEPDDRRRKLLNSMSSNLKERSLVDVVFASPCSQASDPMESRDLKEHPLLNQIDAAGSTQDLIKYIASKDKVCMVTLDYAGLSTNTLDLKEFLSTKTQIKKVIVDLFPYTNEMTAYDCHQLLEDPGRLKVFDCRKAFYKRSK